MSSQRTSSGVPAQFILSPPVDKPAKMGWRHVRVGATDVHFDEGLGLHHATNINGTVVALLGYALDPDDPGATDVDVASDLAACASDRARLLSRLGDLSGRFIVVVDGPDGRYAIGDAFGLRNMFYTTTPDGVWVASQPALLAELLNLPVEPGAAAFAASRQFAAMLPSSGQWWPPYRSIVAGVRHLPPNHLLDLSRGGAERFWPSAPLMLRSDDECRAELARTLRGAAVAAARRAPLTLLLTGGHDSRLVLAALRPVIDEIETLSIHTFAGKPHDWELPAKLAAEIGFHHDVVDASSGEPTDEFWAVYKASVPVADRQYAANAEALMPRVASRFTVTGHGAEVGKKVWRQARFARRATPARLALDLGMGNHQYARDACAEWLRGLGPGDRYRGDLLYWEQRMGSWAANWMLGYDNSWRDALLPFGNRRLMASLIARRSAANRFEDPQLWDDLISKWWPDLLALPYGYIPVGRGSVARKIKRSVRYLRAR